MELLVSGVMVDISEVSEFVVDTWDYSNTEHQVCRAYGYEAMMAVERMFQLPALDLSGTHVAAMRTGLLTIRLRTGEVDFYEVLNDRLARPLNQSGVAYRVATPSKYQGRAQMPSES